MPLSTVEQSVASDGNRKIIFIPGAASNPLSLAILTGGTAKDLTYSFTEDGLDTTGTKSDVTDDRYTLQQTLSAPGKTAYGPFAIKYVFGGPSEVARVALTEATIGFLVIRFATPNATAFATGQKVDAFKINPGRQMKNPPTANGVELMSQKLYVIDVAILDGVIVA